MFTNGFKDHISQDFFYHNNTTVKIQCLFGLNFSSVCKLPSVNVYWHPVLLQQILQPR